jgi:hypothetical protein
MKTLWIRTALVLIATAGTGCSYSFTGTNLGGLKNVTIPVFANETSEPGIREKLTNELTRAIIDDNNLKVTDRQQADAILSGKITRIEDLAFSFEGSGTNFSTKDYKITIQTAIKFENTKDKKIIWEENISGWGRYSLSGDKRRADGVDEAIRMITQNILNKMVSNW